MSRSPEAKLRRLEKERAIRQDMLERAAIAPKKPRKRKKSKLAQVVGDQRAAQSIPGTYRKLSTGDKSGIAWERLRK